MGIFQRLPWLIAAVIGLILGRTHPGLVIFWLMAALFITQAATGLAIAAFFDMTVKTIPINLRGRLFALRNLGRLSYRPALRRSYNLGTDYRTLSG